MKQKLEQKKLTFGKFIVGVYAVCGKRKAKGIVQLAVIARMLQFRGPDRFLIS